MEAHINNIPASPEKKNAFNTMIVNSKSKKQDNRCSIPNIEYLINNVKSRNDRAEHDLLMFLNKTKVKIASSTSLRNNNVIDAQAKLIERLHMTENIDKKSELTIEIPPFDKDKASHKEHKLNDTYFSITLDITPQSKKPKQIKFSNWNTNLCETKAKFTKSFIKTLKQPDLIVSDNSKFNELSTSIKKEKKNISKSIISMISTIQDKLKESDVGKPELSILPPLDQNLECSCSPKSKLNHINISNEQSLNPQDIGPQALILPHNQNKSVVSTKLTGEYSKQLIHNCKVIEHCKMKCNPIGECAAAANKKILLENETAGLPALNLYKADNQCVKCPSNKKKNNIFCCF